MSGAAVFGSDYNLSNGLGRAGQVTIPPGADSVVVTLNALTDTVRERSEAAVMTLGSGADYKLPSTKSAKKATVTIANLP